MEKSSSKTVESNETSGQLVFSDAAGALNRSSGAHGERSQRRASTIFFGKVLMFMTIISILFVGFFINLLQLVLQISIRLNSRSRRWRSWHKKINGELEYILLAPTIALLYTWNKIHLNIQLSDISLIEDAQKPILALIMVNHSYELDYMVSFTLADQLSNLGAYKSFSKEEIKYLPILGWGLWMSDIIFVKRNWKQDRPSLARKLNTLLDYDQTIVGLFAEGTRWTPAKQIDSLAFAKSRNLKPLKHHLFPRARGFCFTVRHYLRECALNGVKIGDDGKGLRIFNMQVAMPDQPRFRDFIEGHQLRADVYFEEVTLTEEILNEALNSKDEDDCPKLKQLVLDIYRRKDELVDEYQANGNKFLASSSKSGPFPYQKRNLPVIIWLLGLIVTYSTLAYLAVTSFADSYVFWSLLIGYITACAFMLRRLAKESYVRHSLPDDKLQQQQRSGCDNTDNKDNHATDISPAC